MSRPPSCQSTPQFYRISDKDLTEIELHSVDSINDLHRTHEHSQKGTTANVCPCVCYNLPSVAHCNPGIRPPRPAYTPAPNGNLPTSDRSAISHRRHATSKWQSHLQGMLTPSSSRAYAMGCAIVTLLLLTVFLIFYFLGRNTPASAIYSVLHPLKHQHMCQTMSSLSKFHTSSVHLIENFDKQPKIHFTDDCFHSSPAGRRSPAADRSVEGKGGCSHRAVAPDTGTAGAQTQPDRLKRSKMRRRGTHHPSSMLDWKIFASPVKIIKKNPPFCMRSLCQDKRVTALRVMGRPKVHQGFSFVLWSCRCHIYLTLNKVLTKIRWQPEPVGTSNFFFIALVSKLNSVMKLC